MCVNKKLYLVFVEFFIIVVCKAEYDNFDKTSSCPRFGIADFTYTSRTSYFGEYTHKKSENCVDERYDDARVYGAEGGNSCEKELLEHRAFIEDASTLDVVAPILNDETDMAGINRSNIDSSDEFLTRLVCWSILAFVVYLFASRSARASEWRRYSNNRNDQGMPRIRNTPIKNHQTFANVYIVASQRDRHRRDQNNRNDLIFIMLFIIVLVGVFSSPPKSVLESSE